MIKFPFLLIAVVAFLAGTFLLWKIVFSKNINGELSATVAIGEHSYQVEVAKTFTQMAKGLAGRESLMSGTGMLFLFGGKNIFAFTMQGMRFPLDIVWIADGKIVDISENLQPDTGIVASAYRPTVPVDTVLELNAGVAGADGLKIGDSVVLKYK